MCCNNASTWAAAVEMEKRKRCGWSPGISESPGRVGLGGERDCPDCRGSVPGKWKSGVQKGRNVDENLFLKNAGSLSMFEDRKVRGKI